MRKEFPSEPTVKGKGDCGRLGFGDIRPSAVRTVVTCRQGRDRLDVLCSGAGGGSGPQSRRPKFILGPTEKVSFVLFYDK